MDFIRTISVVAISGLLAGCISYDLSSGRDGEVAGSGFVQELYPRYEELSVQLQELGDPEDSEHFNLKARDAAMRSPVIPDEPMDRDFAAEDRAMFEAARYDLLVFFNDRGVREVAPAVAAEAQVSFDCWMEAVEASRTARAETCQQAFEDSLAAFVSEAPDAPVPYIVYFDFDSVSVDDNGMAMIDRAIATAARYELNEFSVTGHTDRAGSEDYNARLSLRRAEAVAAILRARGVGADEIFIAGRGESENAVPTADGVREQQNRRVEIIVQ